MKNRNTAILLFIALLASMALNVYQGRVTDQQQQLIRQLYHNAWQNHLKKEPAPSGRVVA